MAVATQLHQNRGMRAIYLALGFVSLGVGIIGIALPLVPTTGPVLLAAFFFAKSSERFHSWLLNHRRFGPGIRDYQAGLGIPVRAKIAAVVMIVISFGISILWVVNATEGRIALAILAVAISVYIVSRPTKRLVATHRSA